MRRARLIGCWPGRRTLSSGAAFRVSPTGCPLPARQPERRQTLHSLPQVLRLEVRVDRGRQLRVRVARAASAPGPARLRSVPSRSAGAWQCGKFVRRSSAAPRVRHGFGSHTAQPTTAERASGGPRRAKCHPGAKHSWLTALYRREAAISDSWHASPGGVHSFNNLYCVFLF